jgi:hypothetical protein
LRQRTGRRRRSDGDLCRLAAEASAEAERHGAADPRAQAAHDRTVALDALAVSYPPADIPGALYAVALAAQAADDLAANEIGEDGAAEIAERIKRLLRPVLPLLRAAGGESAARVDVSRLLPSIGEAAQ